MKMRGKRVGYLRNIGAGTGNTKHCHGCLDGCEGAHATRTSEKRETKKEIESQLKSLLGDNPRA